MDFDKIINRQQTDSIKWSRDNNDVLPLWVADMDFAAPPPVIAALRERISHGIFGYSAIQDSTKSAIQSWVKKRHNWDISLDDILIVPGVVHGMNLAAAACTNPGDGLLVQTPAYHPFFELAKNCSLNLDLQQLSTKTDGEFGIDIDQFRSSLNPQTRIFMLCNPQNPTGRVFQKDELLAMSEICIRNNIIICSDEIHSDIVFSGAKHTPTASLADDVAQSTITLLSASKTFNLAGLKSSAVIISNPDLREKFQTKMREFSSDVNLLGEIAMSAAYSHGQDWLRELLVYLEANRDFLAEYVTNNLPGINMHTPEGTYLGWLDCSGTGIDKPAEYFLANAKVSLNSGDWFGDDYSQYVRINFGCPRETLISALDRIKASLA